MTVAKRCLRLFVPAFAVYQVSRFYVTVPTLRSAWSLPRGRCLAECGALFGRLGGRSVGSGGPCPGRAHRLPSPDSHRHARRSGRTGLGRRHSPGFADRRRRGPCVIAGGSGSRRHHGAANGRRPPLVHRRSGTLDPRQRPPTDQPPGPRAVRSPIAGLPGGREERRADLLEPGAGRRRCAAAYRLRPPPRLSTASAAFTARSSPPIPTSRCSSVSAPSMPSARRRTARG